MARADEVERGVVPADDLALWPNAILLGWGQESEVQEEAPHRIWRGEPCPICFELGTEKAQLRAVSTHSWSNSDRCNGHGICAECMRHWVEVKVLDEGIWSVRCPGEGCRYRLLDENLRDVLRGSPRADEVLERQRQLQEGSGGERLVEAIQEALAVPEQAWVLTGAQACPSCNVLAFRDTGCLHLSCRCGANFCFGCGAPYGRWGEENCLCNGSNTAMLGLWLLWHWSPVVADCAEGLGQVWRKELYRLTGSYPERLRMALLEWQEEERWRAPLTTLAAFVPGALDAELAEAWPVGDRYRWRLAADLLEDEDDVLVPEDEARDLEDDMEIDWGWFREDEESVITERSCRRERRALWRRSETVKAWERPSAGVAPCRRKAQAAVQPRRLRNTVAAAPEVRRGAAEARRLRTLEKKRIQSQRATKHGIPEL